SRRSRAPCDCWRETPPQHRSSGCSHSRLRVPPRPGVTWNRELRFLRARLPESQTLAAQFAKRRLVAPRIQGSRLAVEAVMNAKLSILLVFLSLRAASAENLSGRVTDTTTGAVVQGALVYVAGDSGLQA